MRKLSLCLLLIFISSAMFAGAELKVPELTGRVVDKAGILSAADKSRIESQIMQFETATGGQMAVLIIPSIKGDALEPFSMRVAEKWKIGYKGKDNRLILLISVNDHKIRLEVGYGYEGNINDAKAGDIIRGMRPYFRSGMFAEGIIYAVTRSQEFITGKPAPAAIPAAPSRAVKKESEGDLFFRILVAVVLFIIITRVNGLRGGRGFIIYSGGFGSSGGGFGGGGFSGGGFSGGGGGFGGGGASGGW